MSLQTTLICDRCGQEIQEPYNENAKWAKLAKRNEECQPIDLCLTCAAGVETALTPTIP
jgi:hypothetical protein